MTTLIEFETIAAALLERGLRLRRKTTGEIEPLHRITDSLLAELASELSESGAYRIERADPSA